VLEPRRASSGGQGGKKLKLFKILGAFLLVMVAALVVIPLVVLAGLFVWLKLTEEGDEESLELDQETV
jgi:hypothetical protein